MRKVVAGLIVVAVVLAAGVGGYLGVDHWAQQAVAREVDALLDGWQSSVGSATRGRIEIDLWARTVKVADVVVQPREGKHPRMTVGQLIASGLDLSGKPKRIELVDVETVDGLPGQPAAEVRQRAPRVTLTELLVRPLVPRKVTTATDSARLWLELFSAITASSIEVPSLTVMLTQDNAGRQGVPLSSEYKYTNLVLRDVHDGKIAEATMDSVALRGNVGPPFYVLIGEIGKSSVRDADVAPLLAFLDPASRKSGGYQRVYGQLSMGPYTLQMGLDAAMGMSLRIDGLVADDIGFDPGKLSLDDLTFLAEIAGSPGAAPDGMPLSPGQLTMLIDKMAGLYEGVSLGKLDVQGLDVSSLGEQVKLARIRVERMQNGRLGELAFDALETKPRYGEPVSFGRIALTGFDLANFIRLIGLELATPPGQPPSLDRLAGMSNLLQGFELKGIVVPDPRTGGKVLVDARVSSGDLVGTVPSAMRASFKVSVPLSLPAPTPIDMLAAAGLGTLAAEGDVGMHWSEATQTLALEPATVEVGGVMALSVKTSLGKVSRDLFSADIVKAMEAAALVDLGPIEVTLRDLGLVDIMAETAARAKGQGPETGRDVMLEELARSWQPQLQLYPAAQGLYDAVGQFVRGKGETLTVRLTPRGRVRMLAMLQALQLAPDGALLAAFTVEAASAK